MSEIDPLVAALIAKLPPSGTDWPTDRQQTWLKLMAGILGVIYGGDASVSGVPAPSSPAKPFKTVHRFYIDEENYVRKGNGTRVLPDQVNDIIFDLRGDGDLRAIIWADDSTGVNGRELHITAAT